MHGHWEDAKASSYFFCILRAKRGCCGVIVVGKGNVASRAFGYTNAIFALQNACWAVPNPRHSARFRCRLRVFSKRFYLYKVEFQDSCALQF